MSRIPFHGIFRLAVVLGFVPGLPAGSSRAGTFSPGEGQGQMIAGVGYVEAARSFDSTGKAVVEPAFRKLEAGAYFEYGLSDWVTLIVAPSLVHMSAGAPAVSYSGSSESAIGAQFRLFGSQTQALSIQALVEPGIGRSVASPAFGDPNGWAGNIKLQFGQAFTLFDRPAFVDAGAGAEIYGGGWPDEGRFDATFGIRPWTYTLFLVQDFTRAAPEAGPAIPRIFATTLQLSLVQDLSARWSVQIGALRTLAGCNAARETGPVAALWMRF
ncbi:MAG: hypothetical protein ABSA13_12605 [Beijerinckiaceae bacterium]